LRKTQVGDRSIQAASKMGNGASAPKNKVGKRVVKEVS